MLRPADPGERFRPLGLAGHKLVRDALAGAITVYEAGTLTEAVEQAFGLARPAGVVLLAPACASFDMFRDYAERGRRFKEEVKRLMANGRIPLAELSQHADVVQRMIQEVTAWVAAKGSTKMCKLASVKRQAA